jgi:hypothetical protein
MLPADIRRAAAGIKPASVSVWPEEDARDADGLTRIGASNRISRRTEWRDSIKITIVASQLVDNIEEVA